MAKYDPDHKPGAAAKLPKTFAITGSIRQGTKTYRKGDEKAYAESKPAKVDYERLKEKGVIVTGEDAKEELGEEK